MVIKLPRSRESTPVAVTPPSTTLVRFARVSCPWMRFGVSLRSVYSTVRPGVAEPDCEPVEG